MTESVAHSFKRPLHQQERYLVVARKRLRSPPDNLPDGNRMLCPALAKAMLIFHFSVYRNELIVSDSRKLHPELITSITKFDLHSSAWNSPYSVDDMFLSTSFVSTRN